MRAHCTFLREVNKKRSNRSQHCRVGGLRGAPTLPQLLHALLQRRPAPRVEAGRAVREVPADWPGVTQQQRRVGLDVHAPAAALGVTLQRRAVLAVREAAGLLLGHRRRRCDCGHRPPQERAQPPSVDAEPRNGPRHAPAEHGIPSAAGSGQHTLAGGSSRQARCSSVDRLSLSSCPGSAGSAGPA